MAAKASLISYAVEIADTPARALHGLIDGRHRAETEHARLDRTHTVGNHPCQGLKEVFLCPNCFSDYHRRRTTIEPRRIAGSDRAVLAKSRLQLAQALEARIRTVVFVCVKNGRGLIVTGRLRERTVIVHHRNAWLDRRHHPEPFPS